MKKFYNLKIMMAALLVMLMSVGNVFADRGWVQVTYSSNLSVGDTVVIAALTFDKAVGSTQNTNNRAAVDVIKSNDGGMITSIGSAQMFIVQAGNTPGTIAFFDPNYGTNGGYLYAAGTGNQNYMRTEATLDNDGRGDWLVAFSNDGAIESIVAQTTETGRNIMRYNSGNNIFSCYGSGQQPITLYRFEEVAAAVVATPEFSVPQGTYYTPQTVSLSCATVNATILYTIDGSEPATNGLVYSIPLNITATTTVKAIAFLGTDTSFMSQATYTFPIEVPDIAAFKSASTATNSTPYHVASDLTFVFRSGMYTYVKDASAGLLIYDNTVITSEYGEGDVIPGGVYGTYTKYNQQVELIPLMNTAASTQNTGTVQPIVVTMADLLANYNTYDAQLVTLENVTFPNGFTGGNTTTITQGESSMAVYKRFSAIPLDTTLAAGTVTNVTGFVGKYNNNVQIYPRGNFDLSAAPQPAQPSLTVTGLTDGDEFSTLDTLHVDFDIQNFTLGTDGWLKLESEMFTTIGMQSPMYMNDQMLAMFLAQTFSPLPAGTHTVIASLVDMTMQPLTPTVSQSVTFTVTAPVAETPVISPDAGTYADSVVVTMTCATPGAQIRYTIYGEEPSSTSNLYEGPFTLNSSRTVKAKAFMNNVSWEDSPIAEAAYNIVSGPTLTVDPTSLAFGPNNLTSTVNIYSASLTDPITISSNNNDFQLSATSFPANVGNTSFTITYAGFGPAFGTVTVSSGTLSAQIDLVATAQLPAPVITPASGTTDTVITVVMSDDVQGAGIGYTLDGTDPDVSSPTYNQPIILNVPGTYVVKAYAFLEGWGSSDITTATYTVEAPVVPSIDTIMYSVGFEAEEGFTATQTYNNPSVVYTGAEGQQWGTVYGTPATNDHICGAQSMQMRWYTSAASTLGYTFTNFDIRNVTYVTFDAKSPNGLKLNVSYSIDGGNTYVGDSLYTIATGRHNYRFNVSETGEYNFVRLKFAVVLPETTPSGTSKLLIDSVVVFGVPGVVVNVVETPVIAPNGGTYYEAFDATITCATADAVIRYTTDGTEPTETSTVYTAPVTINTTTTLKAKAWKDGMEASMVATVTYNFPPEVANIAAFKAASTTTNTTVYKITGDVNFVFRSTKYMYVEDESAALLIYDNNTTNPVITTTYNEGDVISGGIFGSYTLYNGMVEMIPAQNTPAATGTPVTITPMVATIPILVSQYSMLESRLVTIENVTFIGDKKFVNGTDTMNYYNRFSSITNDPAVGETGSITGFLANYNGQVQLYPRDDNDFTIQTMEQVATPVITPASGTYEGSVEVSISCATEGAIIYYTMDGTDPDENSGDYGGSFVIAATSVQAAPVTVKAIAMKTGMLNSEMTSATYTITPVGIHDMQQQVSIYPNPTSSDVTLDLSGLNARTVELFSMNGQLLNSVIPTENVMTLSLSQYAAGIYFVRIYSDNAVTTQKIVKK